MIRVCANAAISLCKRDFTPFAVHRIPSGKSGSNRLRSTAFQHSAALPRVGFATHSLHNGMLVSLYVAIYFSSGLMHRVVIHSGEPPFWSQRLALWQEEKQRQAINAARTATTAAPVTPIVVTVGDLTFSAQPGVTTPVSLVKRTCMLAVPCVVNLSLNRKCLFAIATHPKLLKGAIGAKVLTSHGSEVRDARNLAGCLRLSTASLYTLCRSGISPAP